MKTIFLALSLCLASFVQAQVLKQLNVATAGNLSILISPAERTTVTSLTLRGNINSTDFSFMLTQMPSLSVLDLSCTYISATINTWPANTIPSNFLDQFFQGNPANNAAISSLKLPCPLTSIAANAFENLHLLTSISIPASVSSIRDNAFMACSNLTSIYVQSSVPIVFNAAAIPFSGITLNNITLYVPSGSLAAYQAATKWNSFGNIVEMDLEVSKTLNLTAAATLGAKLTASEQATITNLTLTGIIAYPDFRTMKAMPNLKVVDLSGTTIQGGVYPAHQIPLNAFDRYNDGPGVAAYRSIILPSNATSIAHNAFENCSYLKTITIPSTVTSIGDYAFALCTDIRSIYVKSSTPVALTDVATVNLASAFTNLPVDSITLYVPTGTVASYRAANQWRFFTHIVEENPVNVTTEGNSQSIQLYPNPVENELSVAGIEGNASIQIVTLEGKSLLNQTIKSNEKVNVTQLAAGLYIARITTADGTIEKKIVKQ